MRDAANFELKRPCLIVDPSLQNRKRKMEQHSSRLTDWIIAIFSVIRWFVILSSVFWCAAAAKMGMWLAAAFFASFVVILVLTRHVGNRHLRQLLNDLGL